MNTWTLRVLSAANALIVFALSPQAVLSIAILGALPAACSERQAVECDADCVAAVKSQARYGEPFKAETGEQLQTDFAAAFAAAKDELAHGDWSQRLSEIQQEFCRTPGKVDSEKVRGLETAMFNKLAFETHGVMAAYPNELAGAEAIRKWRVEGVKYFILKVRVRQIMVACYTLSLPANAAKQ
jgi:hypothetical protein